MTKFTQKMGRFLRYVEDRAGVSTVEYALIVVAVIGIIGAGAAVMSGAFNTLFTELETQIDDSSEKVKSEAEGQITGGSGSGTTTTGTTTTGTTT